MRYDSLEAVRGRIDSNYKCLQEMEQLVPLQNTEEEKLGLISFIGKMYAEYVTGVYASSDLEKYIRESGESIDVPVSGEAAKGQFLIVMTAAGITGGHTVLVHNWIKWDDENTYSIAFTDMDEVWIPQFIKEAVQESGGRICCLQGEMIEKAKKLSEVSCRFQRIILFTHMEDVIPVLAYGRTDWAIPVYFYNHADFRFSYGFSVADVVMNLNNFDADKSIRYRGICKENSVYIQFPGMGIIEKKRQKFDRKALREMIGEKYGIDGNEKLIVSMGDDFKYENIIGYEFDAYVTNLLNQSTVECYFLIIGADQEREKWIRLCEKTQGKARALGILPREEAEQIISAADLFVTSFPMLAAGRIDADQAGVPSLWLDIIGRYGAQEDIGRAGSVAELTEKSLDILGGNGNRYLHAPSTKICEREEWKRSWRSIYTRADRHTIHSIHPQRLIEKQEYVNCQLMQERAPRIIYDYITRYPLNGWTEEELYRLDNKYNMGISHVYVDFLKKKCKDLEKLSDHRLQLSEKHLQLYLLSLRWLEIKRKGKRIDEFLCERGYRTIVIYGMGQMGQSLAEELSGSLLETIYGIDRNADRVHSVIPVYAPMDQSVKADLIINTTTIDNEMIMEGLGIQGVEMIRFGELLNIINET